MLAMTTGYGESDETFSDRLVTFYAKRARGGAGMEKLTDRTHSEGIGSLGKILQRQNIEFRSVEAEANGIRR
jgi:2,4-dienoyl-CoA reductase-like NADH-dependent reductase (Old Yellow Enzyme family)